MTDHSLLFPAVNKVKVYNEYYALRILEPCSSTTEAMERNGAKIHASFSNSTNKLAQEVILNYTGIAQTQQNHLNSCWS